MGSLLVLILIAGCAAFQFFKGSMVRGIITIIVALCASFFSFGYFEPLGRLLAKQFEGLTAWSQCLSFTLLFILTFAVLQTLAIFLLKEAIHFGSLPERIGRIMCGVLLGWIVAGVLLTAMALSPLSAKWPYARFDTGRPRADSPKKVLLNADGLVTAWFSILSNGSFRAIKSPQSFAALHPNFLDQLFLNRLGAEKRIHLITTQPAIEVPRREAAWPAPDSLVDENDKPIQAKSGTRAMIIRVGFTQRATRDSTPFWLSQLRAVCKSRDQAANPLSGKASNVYPSGYMVGAQQVALKPLNHQVSLNSKNFVDGKQWMDVLFYIPSDLTPVFMEFKLNNIVSIPKPLSPSQQAPDIIPFSEKEIKKQQRPSDADNVTSSPQQSGSGH